MLARKLLLVLGAVAWLNTTPVHAEEVSLDLDGMTLLGDVEGNVNAERFVVLVHGTLAHKDMELIDALQAALSDRDISSLAITLSLGISGREGMYDCAVPHNHQMENSNAEIDAWMEWLGTQRSGPVALLGHSRGGARVAWYAAESPNPLINEIVLMAPAYGDSMDDRLAGYKNRFGADLGAIIREARDLVASGQGDTMVDMPGFLYCPDTQATAATVISYYDDDDRRSAPVMAEKIELPILVIAGSLDTVVPEVPARFTPLADAGRVQLEIVDNADHMFLDFFAEDAADLIDGFVGSGS